MTVAAGPANHLARESSPYLRQHAHNPVHWRPWGPGVLEEAKRTDRPIHLSIGYSACHWCHVMAHESFEDPAVAELLNERFVNVKVDREEHPELDHVYQLAHQLLTGRGGGWPLTMFLAPDGRPFFGGTYFPPTPRHGLPAFPAVLLAVADHYRERRTDVDRMGEELTRALSLAENAAGGPGDRVPGEAPLGTARAALQRDADLEHGGFGGAPKFPRPGDLERLLRHHDRHPDDPDAPRLLRTTLHAMADRGLHDHLDGGFHRYCVDDRWDIPHFEKMLYDNAQLLGVYADGWAAYGDSRFREVAESTAEWMLRELRHPLGGFFSTLDADSGEGEGAYYVWSEAELREVLGEADLEWARARYGLAAEGNFEGRHHLHRGAGGEELARRFGFAREAADERLEGIRTRLLAARSRRPRPGRDEKILASWNGLAIRALARAGRLLERPDWVEAADRAAGFIRRTLRRDGRLLAVWTDGRARFAGRLDDHAFLLDGLLELLQARWSDEQLRWACTLADQLLERFEDRDVGGFFLTAHDDEPLIHRPKPAADGATPSGNGIAARALLRLGCLVGDPRYLEAADRTLRAFARTIERLPPAHGALLDALEEHLAPGPVVILRGRPEDLAACRDVCRRGYHPRRACFLIPPDADLPEALAHKRPLGARTAYVCAGTRCSPPISTPEALAHERPPGVMRSPRTLGITTGRPACSTETRE